MKATATARARIITPTFDVADSIAVAGISQLTKGDTMASVETATTDFASNLRAQFQRITAMHPQLLDAVPPEPIERRHGTFTLNVATFWEEFCSREWQARPGDDANLVGPFHMYGECLAPFIPPGELHWYDSTLPARDGDIVLVQWAPEVLAEMYERNGSNADWLRQYGEPCPIATKVYKTNGRSQWLLTRKSMVPLAGNRILGVLRRRVRDHALVSAIEPNAATDILSAADPGPIMVSLVAPATQIANQHVKYVTATLPFDSVVEVTANYRAGITSTGTFEMYSFLYRSVGVAMVDGTERIYKSGTVYEPFAAIAAFSASAGTYRFGIGCTIQLGNGVNNVDAIFRDINLRVTVVKR